MNKYGLIGGKLGHSLSPAIHRLFFEFTGKQGSYELLETEQAELEPLLARLRGEFAGVNVTIPHKCNVMPYLDAIAPEAAAIGAVNTLKLAPSLVKGYNTDYFGFGRMLEYNGIELAGRTVAVLGTGGAARAVVKYLADQQVGSLYLVTRDVMRVPEDFQRFGVCVIDYARLASLRGELLVNCTPVGMFPKTGVAPVDAKVSAAFEASVDLIYNPARTLFLQQAADAGHKAVNGLFMLVAQAVAAQEIWQDEHYDAELIVRIMQALEKQL